MLKQPIQYKYFVVHDGKNEYEDIAISFIDSGVYRNRLLVAPANLHG